jgi:hypothetical protein
MKVRSRYSSYFYLVSNYRLHPCPKSYSCCPTAHCLQIPPVSHNNILPLPFYALVVMLLAVTVAVLYYFMLGFLYVVHIPVNKKLIIIKIFNFYM